MKVMQELTKDVVEQVLHRKIEGWVEAKKKQGKVMQVTPVDTRELAHDITHHDFTKELP